MQTQTHRAGREHREDKVEFTFGLVLGSVTPEGNAFISLLSAIRYRLRRTGDFLSLLKNIIHLFIFYM